MDRRIKIEQAHAYFKARRYPSSKSDILKHLQCSVPTFKRIIKTLREEHGAPLIYQRESNGYLYTNAKFELDAPGFWLNPHTLLALLGMQKLLVQLRLDFLNQPLSLLGKQIEQCLRKHHFNPQHLDRIRILPINARIHDPNQFQQITAAVLQRQCLTITYYARGKDETTRRTVSPQRLAHYKDNWYLDAWCHLRQEMRIFALDGLREVVPDNSPCIDIDQPTLDALLASGYGIFSGNAKHTAVLRFSARRARWVATEQWHPQQISTWLDDGRYQLHIPYADARELLMDIQRHLPEVEIVAPPALKQALVAHLQQAIAIHQTT
ncbi:helix-turn-helix transcriptional regulator [Methylophilus aquaticus]|uniref:WYL domain-containing protein n=1 Tax=Methylophilus aquaticus TaxID=1971610 RepID=A0ABT9JW96_9PROT|nr:WYL domain-containing protein [Methylophilus aquaticus]MDP8568749.1 WYL domain-containing protein [Methylophilus aquaticus]